MVKTKNVVLFLIGTLEVGGAEKQLLSIVSLMSKKQEVIVVAERGGPLLGQFQQTGARVLVLPPWSIFHSSPRISTLLSFFRLLVLLLQHAKKYEHLIVEAFLPSSILIGAVAKVLYSQRLVLIGNRRSHVFYRRGRHLISTLDKWASARCDALVCNSPSVAEEARIVDRVDERSLYVIPNGIVQVSSKSPTESQLTRRPQIIHVSNHHAYKRTVTLLEAIAQSPTLRSVPAHLFGQGSETEYLVDFVVRASLENVVFHGQDRNPWRNVRQGDIYVHTSETEGFSNSVLEAMNLGLVLVLSDIPSNRFVASHCAAYFPVGDAAALMKVLQRLLKDKGSRRVLVQNGWERIEHNFKLENVVEQRQSLHQALISKHQTKSFTRS